MWRPLDVLAEAFGARLGDGVAGRWASAWNLAPTRTLPGLVDEDGPVLELFHWGLANRSFNARAERVSPAAPRLVIVVDGFFEWMPAPGGRRQPLFFRRRDGAPLALAGVREGREACTMVTTGAGADLDGVHDRMPVVLEAPGVRRWLGSGPLGRGEQASILRPAPAGTLTHHPVDPRVGDVRNDGPDLVAPFEPPPGPLTLFG